MTRSITQAVIVLGLSACSSSSALSGAGAFDPNTQTTQGLGTTYPDGGQVLDQLEILAADIDQGPLNCMQVTSPGLVATGKLLRISLFHSNGDAISPDTYEIGDPDAGSIAVLFTLVREPDAGTAPTESGIGGSVTLTQVQPMTQLSFSATMSLIDGGTGVLSGNLSSAFCGVQY